MIRIFQALDAYSEQRVLLLALSDLEIIPSIGEELEVNAQSFVVLTVKHCLSTQPFNHDVELVVVPPEMLVEVEYINQEYDEDYL